MKEKKKKAISKILNIFSLLLFVSAAGLFVYVISCKASGKTPQIFGYSFHFVVSPSMEPDIMKGDFVIGKKISMEKLYEKNLDKQEKDKDVILFVSPNPSDGEKVIVHKIRSIVQTDNGYSIYTYGINNSSDDIYPTKSVIGEVVFVSSGLGKIFNPITAIFVLVMVIIAIFFFFAIRAFIRSYREIKNGSDSDDNETDESSSQD